MIPYTHSVANYSNETQTSFLAGEKGAEGFEDKWWQRLEHVGGVSLK